MKERKNHSLYGAILKKALKHAQPKLRSEHLPEYRRFFVGEEILDLLHNNDEHLIVGRRGTGKTHVLGSFDEMIKTEYPNEMSVMVSLAKLDNNSYLPSGAKTNDSNLHAFSLFHDFLKKLFQPFLEASDRRLTQLGMRLSKQDFKEKQKTVNNLLTNLLETVELGSPIEIEAIKKQVLEENDKKTGHASAELTLGFDNTKPAIAGKIGLGKANNQQATEHTVIERKSILRVDYILAGELMTKILKELDIEVLHILIDEWMELDKRTPSGIQPVFAQLLKKTFFNSNRISTKIASVWHQTSLYDRDEMEKAKGIELKHDIIRSVDLDTAFLTKEEDVIDFCKELLFKRLLLACEEAGIDTDDTIALLMNKNGEVNDIFITELFDTPLNFKAFITSSHAIPRDIMSLFHLSSLKIKRDFETYCIDHETVYLVAKDAYKTDKRKTILPNSDAQKLLVLINSYMENNDRRLFLVENSQVPDSKALQKLVDEELIHQVPSAVTHRSICDTHKTFLVDFGNYIDHIETRNNDISVLLSEGVLAKFPVDFQDHFNHYVVDISVIESEYIKCPECTKSFSIEHPVYITAKLCMHCAYEFEEVVTVNE